MLDQPLVRQLSQCAQRILNRYAVTRFMCVAAAPKLVAVQTNGLGTGLYSRFHAKEPSIARRIWSY